jgi:hypothetical protein
VVASTISITQRKRHNGNHHCPKYVFFLRVFVDISVVAYRYKLQSLMIAACPLLSLQGWEAREDAAGRCFYVDHTTKTTTWLRPTPLALSQHRQFQASHNLYVPSPLVFFFFCNVHLRTLVDQSNRCMPVSPHCQVQFGPSHG